MNKFFIFIFVLLIWATNLHAQIWRGNNIGVDNSVPNPWVPLTLQENTGGYKISCWGRVYEFDSKSLLRQVWAKGDPLLERPVIIKYGINNSWQAVAKKIIRKNQSQITIELLSKTINQKGDVVNLKTNILLTYDGLVFYKLQLNSKSLLSDAISVEIPIKNEYTKLMHRWNYASNKNKQWWVSGLFPSGDQMSYIPYFWSGNSEKGLFWFAESPHNWLNYKDNSAIIFAKNASNTFAKPAAVLNLVKEDQIRSTSWSFEFGMQATPVKPSTDKRNLILSGGATSTVGLIWSDADRPYGLKFYGYPEPKNATAFNAHVSNIQKESKKAIVYNCLSFISDASPEGRQFKSQWNINAKADMASDVRAYAGAFARINFTDRDYQDFIVWKSDQFLKNANFDGYYLDNVMIENLNFNKLVKKFPDNKETLPYYPILEARRLYERFYKMVKNRGKEKLVITHSSSRVVPPILAFSDAYVDGEQFRENGARVNDDYLKVTNLSSFQSEFSGKPFGLNGIFLPAFEKKNYLSAIPTRYLAAILIQHDIPAWPIWSAPIVWDEVYKAFNNFPLFLKSDFFPYYGPVSLVKSESANVLVSAYKNQYDEYLCVVSNLGDISLTDRLRFMNIDLTKYKIQQSTPRGSIGSANKDLLTINVLAKDYLILYLRKK